ncbi:MAG: hypothetical protein ACLPYS_08690, partial [Vulcanimicrobiaceae bacterium]
MRVVTDGFSHRLVRPRVGRGMALRKTDPHPVAAEVTHRYPERVRRLVLAATTAGAVAIPGRFSALLSLLSARRYKGGRMVHVGGELYGGKVRRQPKLLERSRPQRLERSFLARLR